MKQTSLSFFIYARPCSTDISLNCPAKKSNLVLFILRPSCKSNSNGALRSKRTCRNRRRRAVVYCQNRARGPRPRPPKLVLFRYLGKARKPPPLLPPRRPPVVGRIATQNRVTHLGSDRTGLSLMENSVFLRVTSCFGVFGIGQTCSRNLARKPLMHLVHTTPLAAARAREELWFVLS